MKSAAAAAYFGESKTTFSLEKKQNGKPPALNAMRRDEGVPPYRRLRRESDTLSFRALVEKSPAVETITIVHAMRRDEGVPPYRRLRRESYPLPFRALVEKSPTVETARNIYAPAYPPAAAHRREIPRNRNEDERARIINQANDLNALSLRGAQRRGNLPEGKTYLRTRLP